MNTWRDILSSLFHCSRGRLDDPADVIIDGESYNIELLEVDVSEIDDIRLVGYPSEEVDQWAAETGE